MGTISHGEVGLGLRYYSGEVGAQEKAWGEGVFLAGKGVKGALWGLLGFRILALMVLQTDIVKLVVEIESFGMGFDEFDKESVSVDELQLGCVKILNQFDISHKFAPLGRKSI
nr:hypothetical protein [Tanacetum cinerariifolium]